MDAGLWTRSGALSELIGRMHSETRSHIPPCFQRALAIHLPDGASEIEFAPVLGETDSAADEIVSLGLPVLVSPPGSLRLDHV